MAKRNNEAGGFERKPRDFYGTIDPAAVEVFKKVSHKVSYIEPCAGSGDLIELLNKTDMVLHKAYDIEPQKPYIEKKDASLLTVKDLYEADCVVTNPPYDWKMLKPILDNLLPKIQTMLLLPADTMHNLRMAPYITKYCYSIESVGRLYWEPNKVKGKDNFVWYNFFPAPRPSTPYFFPRKQK